MSAIDCPWADHYLMDQDEELINEIKARLQAAIGYSRNPCGYSDDPSDWGDAPGIALVVSAYR